MGADYEKGMYRQLMDVMEKLDAIEWQHKKDRTEIARLTAETKSLRRENEKLREETSSLSGEISTLRRENTALRTENRLLREDNERMKRILNNDSSNSSCPPSGDRPGKAPNTYNGRKTSKKKQGAQPGHRGSCLSKKDVEDKIREGIFVHRTENVGTPGKNKKYITRYRLDLEVKTTATEIRIYEDKNGKFNIPDRYRADVTYGDGIKAVAAFLYSEGVVSNDRICTFINSLSGDSLHISTGSIYGFCRDFAESCLNLRPAIEAALLNSGEVCTDATTVTTNGKQSYIRNFSTKDCVLYVGSGKKNLKTLGKFNILKSFTGILIHDHETAMYHFGTGHGECNVHLERYLLKNTEETGNKWSRDMGNFLNGMNWARKKQKDRNVFSFSDERLVLYEARYDEILSIGREQNKKTGGKIARKEELALLNRLEKYKENHLLFLHNFKVPYSNNMSEKDLRICKNREKMAGGFRTEEGRQMYCDIMSAIETVKRKKLNIFRSIIAILKGTPVIG